MPPKKKKGGKKSGKKKNGQKAGAKPSFLKIDDVFNELSKEFYLIQIRDLEMKIARYQEKCDRLELRNKEVETNFEQQASDKKEIVSFLKKQLEQRSDEIADLQEKLIGLQQSKDQEKDKYELELSTIKTQITEMKDQLTSENMVLGGKLASLEEFRVQKEDLLQKFADMEELLQTQEEDHKEQIYQLERKAVVDKDRLKKEMILRVNTVAAEFRKVSNKQMAETTKRTIRENVMINSQLSKMSEKTVELITESDDAKVKEKKQKQQIEILEVNEKELAKKNAANQKIIKMLTEKAQDQLRELQEYSTQAKHHQDIVNYMKEMDTELNNLKTTQQEMDNWKEQQLAECELHIENINKLTSDKEYLIGLLSDASRVISEALQHNDQEQDDSIREMKNTNLLHKVIEILNLAVEMGVGIDPQELAGVRQDRKSRRPKSKYTDLGPPLAIHKSFSRSQFVPVSKPLSHYKIGDLGLVPSSKSKSNFRTTEKREKPKLYTEEQLAKGTPRQSSYDLVKAKSNIPKLPVLSSVPS